MRMQEGVPAAYTCYLHLSHSVIKMFQRYILLNLRSVALWLACCCAALPFSDSLIPGVAAQAAHRF